MIQFNEIPNHIRSPLNYLEINASNQNANSPADNRLLVLGQMTSDATVAANVPILVSDYAQAQTYFGKNSMLADMFRILTKNNNFIEMWALPLADDSGGTASTGSIVVTASAALAGTFYLYFGDVVVPVNVAAGDSATTIGASIVSAMNANPALICSGSNSSGTVTITYKHKGLVGDYFPMAVNFGGVLAGQTMPSGVTVAITQMSGGASDPSLTTALAALPNKMFNYWVNPYQSSGQLSALVAAVAANWNALVMNDGYIFGAAAGTVSALVTLGNSQNSQFQTILDAGKNSQSPSYLWAAAMAGQVAMSASNDPARPFTTLPLVGILAEPSANRRTLADRNTLLYDGIATHTVAPDGTVLLERVITTYQVNGFNVPDGVYLDITTPLTLSYLRLNLRQRITSKFSRMKLANDGTRYGAGQNIVTPKIIKSEVIAWASQMNKAGLVDDLEDFANNLIVERNQNDPTRVDIQLSPKLVSPLYIVAASISFVL